MQKRWLIVAMISLLVAAPTKAQMKSEPDDFVHDVLRAIFGPNWNVFVNTGVSTNGRFMLQGPIAPSGGERTLESDGGFGAGIGAGVDVLLRTGFRLTYTHNTSDLVFRTNNGDGSTNLDFEDGSNISNHVLAAEVMRYMLPSQTAAITPYATVGLLGTWWGLDDGSALAVPSGGSTQFRFGGLVAFGVQFKLGDKFGARLEAASASTRSPFTGNHSFRALGGPTIDEPTRVGQVDYRIVGVYNFRKQRPPQTTAKR